VVSWGALVPPPTVPPAAPGPERAGSRPDHFRALARVRTRLPVSVISERMGTERQAAIVDLSLAGAGLETDAPLLPGDRLEIALMTPTRWDPIVLPAQVAWAAPARDRGEVDALGRPRSVARAGVAFQYPDRDAVLAVFEMLAALGDPPGVDE
jgi:hypothetical protein